MRSLLSLLLILPLASSVRVIPPQHVAFPGPVSGGQSGQTGTFQNLNEGPGVISIQGNQPPTGNDKITGISNINGQMWANYFPGADIGAQVNNAIAALSPRGGVVHINTGTYLFSTTIQCPRTTNMPIIIEGAGQSNVTSSDVTPLNKGTALVYTGNGDAVNQTIPPNRVLGQVSPYQNYQGCQLRDLTIDGGRAGPNAIGFHFGGTVESGTSFVTISNFRGANGVAVELDNEHDEWTERYDIKDTQIYRNTLGVYWHENISGGNVGINSFGHGVVDIWTNTQSGQTTMRLDGGGIVYSSHIVVDGNLESGGVTMVDVETGSAPESSIWNSNFFEPRAECMSTTTACTLFNVGAGAIVYGDIANATIGSPYTNKVLGWYSATSLEGGGSVGLSVGGTAFLSDAPTNNRPTRISHGSINTRANTFQTANGAHIDVVSNCSGIISVTDQSSGGTGDAGIYMCGGGICNFLGSSRNGLVWTASTTTPALGKASVQVDGVNYAIFNNTGITGKYGVTSICSRDSD